MNTRKMINRNTFGRRTAKALLLLLIVGWAEIAAAQTPVNIRSASLPGHSMEYWGDSRSACLVPVADDSKTKQQWIMVNAGGGSFYLKNVYAESEGLYPYLSLDTNNSWTMTFVSESDLGEANYYFRARFSLVDLGDGTWGIKTMSAKNDAATHFYTYIGVDAPGSNPDYTIWGDKLIAAYGKWIIDGLSTISIGRSAGQVTITASNTTGATVYYTTDGSDPTTSTTRQVYSAPFADNNIALVKAIVMKDGRPNSELALNYDYSKTFVLQHQNNPEFYMLPGVANGADYEVNTYSLPRPGMTWMLEDAGNGSFYLKNNSTGYYLSCNNGGTVRLKTTNDDSDEFKFLLRLAVDGSYRLEAKAKTNRFITKSDNNSHNSVGNSDAKLSFQNYWRILPADHMPALEPPFTLSDNSCAHYYRLQNGGESAYYIIPPTESNVNASASNAGERNDRWFLRQVGSDEWLTYYAIVNATTGQCLQYNGVALGGGAAFTTDMVAEGDMGTTDNVQFAVAPTTTSATNGMYYLVPKPIRYQNSGNYYSLVRYDNTVLKVNLQRADNKHKWVFAASTFSCDAPTASYDAVQGILTLTSPNNAPLYYVAWADGEAEPALATPADGTPYDGPFYVGQDIHFKAIAARCTDGSDQSAVTAYDLAEAFRCARPKITYNSSTKQVSIASATTGADIYYIVGSGDFSESAPNYGGSLYNAPFTLSEPQAVKAIAVKDGVWSTVSVTTVWDEAPHPVSRASEMTVMSLNYVANEGFVADVTVGTESNPFTGSFDGGYHPISLSQPLFGHVDGGTVKNVRVLTLGADFNGTNVGAIANEAKGDTKIYNCGVLDSTKTIAATNAAGGIVGHIASGAAVRVVNCYNYATVAGSVYSGGIVGWNESSTANGTRIAMCMMYGDMTVGTHRSPVYYGGHTSNNQSYNEYNYYRSRASLTYTAYNDQLAIGRDEWLTRFPFYRHILNTHRELAAHFLFGDLSALTTTTAPTEKQVDEIGHWALHTDVAPYPIVEPWEKNTKKTTEGIAAALPATTNRYEGKKLADIAADGIYRSDGTQVTTMGTNGMLHVNYTIAGTTGSVDLPITDMDTLAYDFTWGKVVLPFVNEIDGWTRDYSKVCTGWKITAVNGGTTGTLTNYNFADRDCTAKDLYSNSNYIFAQGGNYIVPYGVTSIAIEAHFATAFYLSDAQADYGYGTDYGSQTDLGWTVPTTYHGRPVYTSLSTLVNDLQTSTNPHDQAVVLVGNYHYNQKVISGSGVFNNYYGKALTIMSVDEDCNQEPDYGWYSYHSNPRTGIPHLRFDFVPNIGIGMAARVTGSTPNPTIGIWQCSGSFELTETCVSFMSECEIEGNTKTISTADNELGNNRYIVNSGYFIQIIRSQSKDVSNLSYLKVGGNAFIEQLYPGTHSNSAQKVKLVPIVVTGGEIKDCYMTGYRAGSVAYGPDIRFWCAGGRIHKFLGAYMDKPQQTADADGHVNMTARVDHALIRRFFGGGTSPAAPITGNIDITMNNSRVDFFCGGPEFGDMTAGKTVTTHALGSTFGMYYGAGFGGTSITRVRGNNASSNTDGQTEVTFSNDTHTFPLVFDNYKYLTPKTGYGIGVNYEFEFIQYAGGDGRGVARFYTGYAAFSLAKTGNVTNTLSHCTIEQDFYGAGCQGTVAGTVTSTLTDCTVRGNAFGGGYKATANTLQVYPDTPPTYSVYTKETGLFSDFGTVEPETWTWAQGTEDNKDEDNHVLYTATVMSTLGTVTGDITITLGGSTTIGTQGDAGTGNLFGGGNESPSSSNTTVRLKDNAHVLGNVYGGGNHAVVGGNSSVKLQ